MEKLTGEDRFTSLLIGFAMACGIVGAVLSFAVIVWALVEMNP